MGESRKFDYYYGMEAEQFSFYRIPRQLVKEARFKGLSSDAKLLYGLMLDRMSLSMKNGWLDEENRAYIIYTIDTIMEDLGCSKPTCTKIMKELDSESGIGLIEKKRRGLGKPDIIYVKNFLTVGETSSEENMDNADKKPEIKKFNFKKEKDFTSESKEIELQEVKKFDLQKQTFLTSGSKKVEPQEVKEVYPNYTNINYTNPIHLSQQGEIEEKPIDRMDGVNAYIALIKENLEYEYRLKYDKWIDKDLYQELFDVICEVVCVKRETVRINGEEYPYELVKSRFLKLNSSHLQYVMGRMKETTTKITNIRAYMITALYNAPMTINHFYQQEVQHDMYGGGWAAKGIV